MSVNCLVADIDFDEGVEAMELMLDTGMMTVLRKGIVDLRKDHLEFTLKSKPSRYSWTVRRQDEWDKGGYFAVHDCMPTSSARVIQ